MANVTKTELLAGILWSEPTTSTDASVGTFQELFGEFKSLLVRTSKNGAAHATVLIQNAEGQTKPIVCSTNLTALVRANKIGLEEIMGFPVFKSTTHDGIYVGLPGSGWVETKKVVKREYVAAAISLDESIA